MSVKKFHGAEPRGLESTPRSVLFEGRFGRMFRTLYPARHNEKDLMALGAAMVAEVEEVPTPETETDEEENQGIDAGYTYLGQFIDHDITFDPASSLQKQNDPNALEDFRTPRFDLDNVYGRGPDDQPYLYDEDGMHMLLGRALSGNPKDAHSQDLSRNVPFTGDKRAIIGDPRNDENVIVSQLQVSFIRFHNRMVKVMKANNRDVKFEEVQRMVRWHYQWVVLHDFLPKIVGKAMVKKVLPDVTEEPELKFFGWKESPFMPVEFSVAAYRFGHSMVRPIYRLNTTLPDRQFIFDKDISKSLEGFREFPSTWAVDWDLFFNPGDTPPSGVERTQKSYKIDTSLVSPLGHLPGSVATNITSLATRNLLRGWRMGLPSGQSVARYMGEKVIEDKDLRIGKATEEDTPNNKLLTDISPNFRGNAPLWYYVLAEAQQQFKKDSTEITLGPVGGRIVTEVFVGLLYGDKHSFLYQEPTWEPFLEFKRGGKFKMKDLLAEAIKDTET
jgi:hypothetical protein